MSAVAIGRLGEFDYENAKVTKPQSKIVWTYSPTARTARIEALDTKLENAVPQTRRAKIGPLDERVSVPFTLALGWIGSSAVERSAATEGRRKRQETMLMTIRLITSLQ